MDTNADLAAPVGRQDRWVGEAVNGGDHRRRAQSRRSVSGNQSRWLCTRSNSPDRLSAWATCSASQTRPSRSGFSAYGTRADPVQLGGGHRVAGGEQRDVDAEGDQTLGDQAGDLLPGPVVHGRRAPRDRRRASRPSSEPPPRRSRIARSSRPRQLTIAVPPLPAPAAPGRTPGSTPRPRCRSGPAPTARRGSRRWRSRRPARRAGCGRGTTRRRGPRRAVRPLTGGGQRVGERFDQRGGVQWLLVAVQVRAAGASLLRCQRVADQPRRGRGPSHTARRTSPAPPSPAVSIARCRADDRRRSAPAGAGRCRRSAGPRTTASPASRLPV